MSQDGRTCELNPGDLALYVTQRPYTLHYPEDQNTLIVHFPQSFLDISPAQIQHLTANPISRTHGHGPGPFRPYHVGVGSRLRFS